MTFLAFLALMIVDCVMLWEPLVSGTYKQREILIVL